MISRFLKYLARKILSKELVLLHNTINQVVKEEVVVREEVRVSHRMSREAFSTFKRKLPAAIVNQSTTDLQAAALVGQQQVLDMIERELVV